MWDPTLKSLDFHCCHFHHQTLWQNVEPPQALEAGSRAAHAPSRAQATYIGTQGPQALWDLRGAWSHNAAAT